MKQELIKPIVRVGNSAGIVLPKEWLNGTAKVILVERPINLKRDIFEILGDYLKDIIGIYVVGSYARGEETTESDIDILAITNSTDKHIKSQKYDIILISRKNIEDSLKNNAFPILPMLIEARAISNQDLIKEYIKIKLTEKNLKYILDSTKSAINIIKEDIIVSEELKQEIGNASAYSLILRLRSLYIIECIRNNKHWKKKNFLSLIKRIAGSLKVYDIYVNIKKNKKPGCNLSINEAKKLVEEVNKRLIQIEEWLKEKKE